MGAPVTFWCGEPRPTAMHQVGLDGEKIVWCSSCRAYRSRYTDNGDGTFTPAPHQPVPDARLVRRVLKRAGVDMTRVARVSSGTHRTYVEFFGFLDDEMRRQVIAALIAVWNGLDIGELATEAKLSIPRDQPSPR